MNPRPGAEIIDHSGRWRQSSTACRGADQSAVSIRRNRSAQGAFWRIGAFHISAIAMTYGAPLLWDLLEDYRIQLAAWAIYLLVAALALTALRPFFLWMTMLILTGVDLCQAQSWVGWWLTYSLAFLTKAALNVLTECVR